MNIEISNLKPELSALYGNEHLDKQLTRYDQLTSVFRETFGKGDLYFFSTPGRTEIGGNHTDHNQGKVLAGSVTLDSIAVASPNGTDQVTVYSRGYTDPFRVSLKDLKAKEEECETTTALIRGIAARIRELGYQAGGFDACITSDVLPGSGLSSSASIEVLIGTLFNALFNDERIPPEEIAMIGQYAENNFFGKPCGLMDQVACAMGGIVTIDFKDPSAPDIRKVDFDFGSQGYSLVFVDTGGSHADLTMDYASVPAEMKSVAKALGKQVCREINTSELLENIVKIRPETGDRALLRALHFLWENERVTEQVSALEQNDFQQFLTLITDSGNSSQRWLQNIYSPKDPGDQGVTLALALSEQYLKETGEGACRVHGGGFAGTIQVFLPEKDVRGFTERIRPVFGQNSVHELKIRPEGTIHIQPEK